MGAVQKDGRDHHHTCGCGREHQENGKWEIIKLIIGAAIFAVGLIVPRLFDVHEYASLAIFITSYIILGGKIVLRACKNILRGRVFDENFLMSIATLGAFAIGEYPEAVAVILFYRVGEYFQNSAVRRSKKSIAELMDIRPDSANIMKDGEVTKVAPDTVNVGDIIIVKPGEKIPLDGVVVDGKSMLDTTALTGESVPRTVTISDTVLSGCINQSGVLTVEVTKTFGESTVAKIINLVESASHRKAPTENFITTFSRYYTPAVVTLAALIAVIFPLFAGGEWADWIHRGLVFLVISCPCALVISIPLGFFGGIGGASKRGVLVKGGNYLEALNNLDIVVFDKTGTLTKGVFQVTDVQPSNGFTEHELIEFAANAEAFSNHPIALSVQKAYGGDVDKLALSEYNEIAGYGVSVRKNIYTSEISDMSNNPGLSANIEAAQIIYAGNYKFMNMKNISCEEITCIGTIVYIAVDNVFVGNIIITDEIKPDSASAIAALKTMGVRKTVMLTGDHPQIAEAVAKNLKLDAVYGGLLPAQKVEMIEVFDEQKRKNGKLAFVGDGINDAPVLARADIGIAMGGLGSDAAIEAADIVLMTDEPSKFVDAINVARFTKCVVWQNIVFALSIKGIILVFGAFGIASMWEAVFADVGVALLAVFNASRVR